MFTYIPKNVCSRKIILEIKDNKITHCEFVGGCTGNTQGVSKLVIGLSPEEVISKLSHIQCRNNTSCPDQLAQALQAYLNENKNVIN